MIIKNWNSFFESKEDELSELEKDEIGYEILLACRKVWGFLRVDNVTRYKMTVPGKLLRMSKNNRILISKVKEISKKRDITEIKKWIESNSYKLFHPNGQYFNDVYGILSNSYKKGLLMENLAKDSIKSWIKQTKNIDVDIQSPSESEDIEGFDLFLMIDGVKKSAQVKTLKRCDKGRYKYFVHCKGHLQILKTDYLVAVNENECFIFETSNSKRTEKYYQFDFRDLQYHEKFQGN
jgi:hypothetical protein